MTRRRASIALSATLGALVLLPAAGADACTCARQSTEEKYESMDAAFTGRLLEIGESREGRFRIYRYRVKRDYKDTLRKKVRVRIPALSSCRLTGNTVGRRYSLFLYRSADGLRRTRRGPWTSNRCLETSRAKLEEASREAESSTAGSGSTACGGSGPAS